MTPLDYLDQAIKGNYENIEFQPFSSSFDGVTGYKIEVITTSNFDYQSGNATLVIKSQVGRDYPSNINIKLEIKNPQALKVF